jgi:hypothetical protein
MEKIVSMYQIPSPYVFDKGYLFIPCSLTGLVPDITTDGEMLVVKPNYHFHMSILAVKKYVPLLAEQEKISLEEAEQVILSACSDALKKYPIKVTTLTKEFRVAEEELKKTLVAMCEAQDIEKFFTTIREAVHFDFPTQPTHITLFTREGVPGIGLTSTEELHQLSRALHPQEIEAIFPILSVIEVVTQ